MNVALKILKILVVLLAVLVVGANVIVVVQQGRLDNTPPQISIDVEVLEISVSAEESEYTEGVTAWDNKDGDISADVVLEHVSQLTGEDTVKVTYAVFDRAGNAATATRTLKYLDYTGPKFSLSKPLSYEVGKTVTLLDRLSAEDDLDGDITQKIRVTSQNLSNDIAGVYHINVQVTNSLGDTQVCGLPVLITDGSANLPQIQLTDYIVYLETGAEFEPRQYIMEVTDPEKEQTLDSDLVEIQSAVDTDVPGTYDVAYVCKSGEEEAMAILTVVVME